MRSVLDKLPAVARILLGLVFFVFGLNGFLHFLPQPPLSGPAGDLMGALAATGYMFPLIKGTEVVVGALLLSGRFVPLALTVLAPVLVHIAAFHLALAPTSLGMVVGPPRRASAGGGPPPGGGRPGGGARARPRRPPPPPPRALAGEPA